MDKPVSDANFRLMALGFKFRDRSLQRRKVLEEVDIKPGSYILDYGCGPGSYSLAAAEMVGKSGKVYALDIHPLAIEMVRDKASRKGLANLVAIHSDCATGLPDESIDVAFLYDIFHELSSPDKILAELHRVLRPDGVLSVNDHHLAEPEILAGVTGTGLFRLLGKGKWVYNFTKGGAKGGHDAER
ncbi:MAG: methyltransferase domain-containing protein [Dehalococcoidales bacterium]|nr:methyltransferase domain-containing protein [Dehalococcoidales bacterium]